MFIVPKADDAITQGDIFDDCPLLSWNANAPSKNLDDLPVNRWNSRVIVLTQACDLAQGKAEHVLVGPIYEAQSLVESGALKGSTIRDQMRRHLIFGWYFLPAINGMPESAIDLRDVHSIPRPILDALVSNGRRIARLASPYREHLAQHFAVTYMRVALPEPYATEA